MDDLARDELAILAHWVYEKGWAPGTGGNFSRVLTTDPLRLLITPSGADKGTVSPGSLLVVGSDGAVVEGTGKPSAETLLHVAIVEETQATVVLHSHSIWNTLASLTAGTSFDMTGIEMLKGLAGVQSHEEAVRIPILENSQDIRALSEALRTRLRSATTGHGVLLRGHGLYTWGCDIFEARRHLEVLEFLFELAGRMRRNED